MPEVIAVLLGLRSTTKRTWPGYWDIIGGHDDALSVNLKKKLGWCHVGLDSLQDSKSDNPKFMEMLHHVYAVTSWQGGHPANVCDEHTELKWFGIGEMSLLKNIADVEYPRFARLAVTGKT